MALADIIDSLPAQTHGLVQLGAVKIGRKEERVRKTASGNEWRAPEKLDHFLVTTMQKAENGDYVVDEVLMNQLLQQYGKDGKLTEIPIRLLSDNIEDVMQSSFCWYGGKTISARSDGVKVTWYTNPKTFRKLPEPITEDWKPEMLELKNGDKPIFKLHSNLSFVIAANESRWGGVYRLRTTSIISFRQLHSSLVMLSQLTGGVLINMPIMLVMRPMQVSPDGKATTIYVVHAELRGGDMRQVQQLALEQMRWRLSNSKEIEKTRAQFCKLLAPPGMESAEDAADIQEEFHPDFTEAESVPTAASEPKPDDALAKKLAADAEKAKAKREAASKATAAEPSTPVAPSPTTPAATPTPETPATNPAAPVQTIEPAAPPAPSKPAGPATQEVLMDLLRAYAKSVGLLESVVPPWIAKRIARFKSKYPGSSVEWRQETLEAFKADNPAPVDPQLVLLLSKLVEESGTPEKTVELWCKSAGVTSIDELPAFALNPLIQKLEADAKKADESSASV